MAFHRGHIHADVDVWDAIPTREHFELAARTKGIDAAEYEIGTSKSFSLILPKILDCDDLRGGPNLSHHTSGDFDLGPSIFHIMSPAADEAMQIRLLDGLRIAQHITQETDMGELLHDVRATPAETHNRDTRVLHGTFKPRAKEALAIMAS